VRYRQLWQVTDVFQEKGIRLVKRLAAEFPEATIVYVDPRPYFKQGSTCHLIFDGIHPSRSASETLANLVWETMEENNIEQGPPCDR
jgi:hypothetical protein